MVKNIAPIVGLSPLRRLVTREKIMVMLIYLSLGLMRVEKSFFGLALDWEFMYNAQKIRSSSGMSLNEKLRKHILFDTNLIISNIYSGDSHGNPAG